MSDEDEANEKLDPEDMRSSVVYPPGLYRIHWKDEGTSLAAVGQSGGGLAWYAPTNWIHVPSFDWSRVERAEKLDDHRGR